MFIAKETLSKYKFSFLTKSVINICYYNVIKFFMIEGEEKNIYILMIKR